MTGGKYASQAEHWTEEAYADPEGAKSKATGKALAEAYLADSRDQGKAVRTVEQRENRLRVHIEPVLITGSLSARERRELAGATPGALEAYLAVRGR